MKHVALDHIKRLVKRTPVIREIARAAMRRMSSRNATSFSSAEYWEKRYQMGRDSGAGSYNRLASFKAEVLNAFVDQHGVRTIIEFGCGDGSQLRLAKYPAYIGVDVSRTVITATKQAFDDDPTKKFILVDEVGPEHVSDLSMSLDVVYHLVENEVFERHMAQLFDSARRYVVVYSSNDDRKSDSIHVRHRRFTDWIEQNRSDFQQIEFVKNAYPEDIKDIDNTSFADFYFFARGPEASHT